MLMLRTHAIQIQSTAPDCHCLSAPGLLGKLNKNSPRRLHKRPFEHISDSHLLAVMPADRNSGKRLGPLGGLLCGELPECDHEAKKEDASFSNHMEAHLSI